MSPGDTDSLALSSSRKKTPLENEETQYYKDLGFQKLPSDSFLSRNIAKTYLHTFAPYLDFSSINEESHLYKAILTNDNRLIAAHSFLSSLRKSSRFYYKDELCNQPMHSFFSTSCKQYIIVNVKTNTEMLKAKGIKRNMQKKCVNYQDFVHATKKGGVSKSVTQYSLKRTHNAIYLVGARKRILSCFTTKRLFLKKQFRKDCAFGFPLHFKSYICS